MKKVSPIVLPALLFFFGLMISYWFSHLQFESQKDRMREHISAELGTIRFIYPVEGNEKALGVNYMAVPDQRDAVVRAMKEKRMVVAGPVSLIQGGRSSIGRSPIFVSARDESGEKQVYWGISSTVIDFQKFMHAAGLDPTNEQFKIALRGKDGLGSQGAVFWGSAEVFSSGPVIMEVPLPSGNWQIAANPIGGWPSFNPFTSLAFLINSTLVLILTLLSSRVLWVSLARKAEVRQRERTEAELRQTNRALRLLTRCNTIVVQDQDEETMRKDLCRIAVESAGLSYGLGRPCGKHGIKEVFLRSCCH